MAPERPTPNSCCSLRANLATESRHSSPAMKMGDSHRFWREKPLDEFPNAFKSRSTSQILFPWVCLPDSVGFLARFILDVFVLRQTAAEACADWINEHQIRKYQPTFRIVYHRTGGLGRLPLAPNRCFGPRAHVQVG